MAHKGWLSFAGTEVVNDNRVRAYVANLLPTLWMNPRSRSCECGDLPKALLDNDSYTDPVTDGAPWVDADLPESADFYGVMPLSITGLTDGTRSARVTESSGNGGSINGVREATRQVRVQALMVAKTDIALHYGEVWLKSALRGNDCSGCSGDELCFMIGCPILPAGTDTVEEIDAIVLPLMRQLRDVTCVEGPTVIREYKATCGGRMQVVEFILGVGVPFVYGVETLVMDATGLTVNAAAPDATIENATTLPACVPEPAFPILFDPACPLPPPPPARSPSSRNCTPEPSSFTTRAVYIPASVTPSSSSAVPLIEMTVSSPVRGVRVRFFPESLEGIEPENLDPCSACGEFVINYMPSQHTFVLDGLEEKVYIRSVDDMRSTAAHLVSGISGEVFSWPELTCGVAYYALIDIPTGASLKTFRLSVAIKE